MSTLSVNQGKMIDLVYFQGYTHQEIANEFKLPLGTVKTRVRQGLIRLKNRKSTKDLLL
jgi:RNA polymerase sigma-70 factor (ECF subfamily)